MAGSNNRSRKSRKGPKSSKTSSSRATKTVVTEIFSSDSETSSVDEPSPGNNATPPVNASLLYIGHQYPRMTNNASRFQHAVTYPQQLPELSGPRARDRLTNRAATHDTFDNHHEPKTPYHGSVQGHTGHPYASDASSTSFSGINQPVGIGTNHHGTYQANLYANHSTGQPPSNYLHQPSGSQHTLQRGAFQTQMYPGYETGQPQSYQQQPADDQSTRRHDSNVQQKTDTNSSAWSNNPFYQEGQHRTNHPEDRPQLQAWANQASDDNLAISESLEMRNYGTERL